MLTGRCPFLIPDGVSQSRIAGIWSEYCLCRSLDLKRSRPDGSQQLEYLSTDVPSVPIYNDFANSIFVLIESLTANGCKCEILTTRRRSQVIAKRLSV